MWYDINSIKKITQAFEGKRINRSLTQALVTGGPRNFLCTPHTTAKGAGGSERLIERVQPP